MTNRSPRSVWRTQNAQVGEATPSRAESTSSLPLPSPRAPVAQWIEQRFPRPSHGIGARRASLLVGLGGVWWPRARARQAPRTPKTCVHNPSAARVFQIVFQS